MSPLWMAVIFGGLAAVAAWAIRNDFRSGVAGDSLYRFRAYSNPTGFAAIIVGKLFIVFLGIAEILHALNIVGDPMLLLRAVFGKTP